MSGVIVPILSKTRFEFSYLTSTASQDVIIQPAVNTSMFNRVQLIVRVHTRNMASTTQTIIVKGYKCLPSDADPREFSDSATFITAQVDNSATPSPASVPGIVSGSQTDPGAFLKFVVTATQGGTSGAILYAELSAVLVLREY